MKITTVQQETLEAIALGHTTGKALHEYLGINISTARNRIWKLRQLGLIPPIAVVKNKDISDYAKARLVAKKLAPLFNKSPEHILMFAVIIHALLDYVSKGKSSLQKLNKATARTYLQGDMPHAAICGVDPDYIKRVMSEIGLEI